MARLQHGLFGGFSGKIGEVEGYIRNGVPYIRHKKKKSKIPPTLKQCVQRQKMAVVNTFLKGMTAFVRLGFSTVARGQVYSANNMAKSFLLKNALTGEYPDIAIDFPQVRLALGKLNMPLHTDAKWQGNGVLFSWAYDALVNWDNRRARAMVLVYEAITKKNYFYLLGACMNEEQQFIELPQEITGKPVHAYLSFVTEDQTGIGDSQYFNIS